jgi:hypothetical protein
MKNAKLIFTACLLLSSISMVAQTDVQNTGTLYISGSGDVVYITGGFTNTSSGALTNNGSLYVRQTLTNGQASMATGTGTLYLNGTSAQSVAGTQPFKTYDLVTNNSSGITLNNNLSVANAHTFTSGVIASSATPNYLIYEAGSSYSGAADSRHVSGWVKKIGTTDFTFPVGNGTYLRSIAIANLSASSEFNCKHNGSTQNQSNMLWPINVVDPYEYWNMPRVSGGTADVSLNWDNSKVTFPNYTVADIRVTQYESIWTSRGGTASGNATTTGTITATTVNNFGEFTFGSLSFAIPLRFISITGQRKNNYNNIDWKVAETEDITHFVVERSGNGSQFTSIGTVAAQRNLSTYSFKDDAALTGTNWYRIAGINQSGAKIYSRVVPIAANGRNVDMYVVNNPVKQSIRISAGDNNKGNYEYGIYTTSGQLLQKGRLTIGGAGIYNITLQAAVKPGVYMLDVRSSTAQFTERLVIE